MSSIPNGFPISLRPWASNTKIDDPSYLPTIIQRINFERGGFHNITEESLRKEITEAELADGAEDSSDEEDDEEPHRAKELMIARDEILRQIDQAHSAAMLCTEVVSAALTKEMPVQASASMSQELRNLIGTGTLGMDKLHAPRISKATKETNKKSARGWQIQSLNKSVDSILAAAERLKNEVEHEIIFWGQVLAINDNRWAICRLPYDRHTLGVRFGSSEASPPFKNRSLGALRRNEDGSITLDQGFANSEPQILRVKVRAGDTETGTSYIPQPVPEGAPIESLILQARNTIFSQELWLELNRESRTLGAYGVRTKNDTLTLPFTKDKIIVLDLVPLGTSNASSTGENDNLAEGISVAFNLFLILAHRHNHRKRTQAPIAKSTEKRSTPPYNLMRPFLTRIKYQEMIHHTHTILKPLCRALQHALPTYSPRYNIKATVSDRISDFPKPEQVLMRSTYNLEAIISFDITDDIWMRIVAYTQISQIGSLFSVEVSPALTAICPPPDQNRPFATFPALHNYITFATSCGLASAMVSKDSPKHTVPLGHTTLFNANAGWQRTSQPNMLKITLPSQKSKQLAIYVHTTNSGPSEHNATIRAMWEWAEVDVFVMKGDKQAKSILKDLINAKETKGNREIGEGVYEWTSREVGKWDDDEGEVVRSLKEIMDTAGKDAGGDKAFA